MCFPSLRGLGISKGHEQSSPGQIPALLQPKASPAPWSHILLGHMGSRAASAAQHRVGLHCSSGPPLQPSPPCHTLPAPLAHQSSQFPHTPSGKLEGTGGQHLHEFNPHPGCSATTSVRNPATSSASQTFSLAWQSPELRVPVPGPQTHDFSAGIKPVTARGQTQALQILSNTKPNTPVWLYDHSFSHCPAFEKVHFTWKHLRNNIHSVL